MADQAVPEGGPKPAPVVIKKYANRRLYNTATSAYVTLDHLSQMVKDKIDFVVYDAKTGDDITRSVLTQIIFEEESKGGQTLLPIPFLRQLISFYGDSLQGVVPQYLEMSMTQFARNQEQMRRYMQNAFGFNPFQQFEIDGQAEHGDVRERHADVQSVPAAGQAGTGRPGGQASGAAERPAATEARSAGRAGAPPQRRGDRRPQAQARRAAEPARGAQQEALMRRWPTRRPVDAARRVMSPCIGICKLDQQERLLPRLQAHDRGDRPLGDARRSRAPGDHRSAAGTEALICWSATPCSLHA